MQSAVFQFFSIIVLIISTYIHQLEGAMFFVNAQYSTLFQQIVNGLSLGSVYALIAVGYSLVYSIL